MDAAAFNGDPQLLGKRRRTTSERNESAKDGDAVDEGGKGRSVKKERTPLIEPDNNIQEMTNRRGASPECETATNNLRWRSPALTDETSMLSSQNSILFSESSMLSRQNSPNPTQLSSIIDLTNLADANFLSSLHHQETITIDSDDDDIDTIDLTANQPSPSRARSHTPVPSRTPVPVPFPVPVPVPVPVPLSVPIPHPDIRAILNDVEHPPQPQRVNDHTRTPPSLNDQQRLPSISSIYPYYEPHSRTSPPAPSSSTTSLQHPLLRIAPQAPSAILPDPIPTGRRTFKGFGSAPLEPESSVDPAITSPVQRSGGLATKEQEAEDDVLMRCTICLDPPHNLAATLCGHVFCDECIRQAVKLTKKCPVCRRYLNARGVYNLEVKVG